MLEETVPTQDLGVDPRDHCHPWAKGGRADTWKSPASELSPMLCRASYNRRNYPCGLQVWVNKASSILGKGNPGRLPGRVIFNLVLKRDLSLTRQYSVTLPTFTDSVLKDFEPLIAKGQLGERLKFGGR